MDRDLLKGYLDRGLSLEEIGRLENRHPSTVGYWVAKHGFVPHGRAKYAPRGGLTRAQIEPLVDQGATLREISGQLGVSISTVRNWIRRYGLQSPMRMRRREVDRLIANGVTTIRRKCRRHGEAEFAIVGSERRLRCKKCRSEAVSHRRRKVKELLVAEAGGRCVLCGYDRCLAALEFHHLDPEEKSFGIAMRGVTRAIAEAREEVRKCILVCGNCHAELEAGVATVPVESMNR